MSTVAEQYARILAEHQIKRVYLMAGGMITHLMDAIHTLGYTKIVCMHHEQAAAFAAEAEGRMTDAPGIAVATSGPGATNLVTGIASCYFDSVPALFITGQVNRDECLGNQGTRQAGFQETNIVELVRPITKHCIQAADAEEAVRSLVQAFAISRSGRPGPVLIDLPTNIQTLPAPEVHASQAARHSGDGGIERTDAFLEPLQTALRQAKRPLALIGGGVRAARCAGPLRRFLETLQLPAVSSLMGLDVLPGDHPLRVGFIGVYGNRWANWALAKADVLLVLGSRLDIRQTGADLPTFLKDKVIFRVDCDPSELAGRVKARHALAMDLAAFLEEAASAASRSLLPPLPTTSWLAAVRAAQAHCDDTDEVQTEAIHPNRFLRNLSKVSHRAAAFVPDVGNNQMWAAQSLRPSADQRLLCSGGLGAMGFAMPAAMGAAFATGRPVVAITGDGGCLVNIQELQTISRNRLPVKLVVLNNRVLGLVRGYQETLFSRRVVATDWGYDAPDFVAVARGFGIPASRIESRDAVATGLAALWQDPSSPYLLEVMIPHDMIVAPNLMHGSTLGSMNPPRPLPVAHDGT